MEEIVYVTPKVRVIGRLKVACYSDGKWSFSYKGDAMWLDCPNFQFNADSIEEAMARLNLDNIEQLNLFYSVVE